MAGPSCFASPGTVLSKPGRLDRWNRKSSKQGTRFLPPLHPHEHWHIDIAYPAATRKRAQGLAKHGEPGEDATLPAAPTMATPSRFLPCGDGARRLE